MCFVPNNSHCTKLDNALLAFITQPWLFFLFKLLFVESRKWSDPLFLEFNRLRQGSFECCIKVNTVCSRDVIVVLGKLTEAFLLLTEKEKDGRSTSTLKAETASWWSNIIGSERVIHTHGGLILMKKRYTNFPTKFSQSVQSICRKTSKRGQSNLWLSFLMHQPVTQGVTVTRSSSL